MNEETFAFFKDYVSKDTAFDVSLKIDSGKYTASNIAEYLYLDDIIDEHFMNLIDYSAKQGKTEMTAVLMQKLHERKMSRGQDDIL